MRHTQKSLDSPTRLHEDPLFFDREGEKSEIVREHRELLRDIHGYLAWTLHSEAEQGKQRGSVNAQRLQELIAQYLSSEGRDPRLVAVLFPGMVERVVFLVSRVEGAYEFEVQPLREYFAARYLYETAPYSPTGAERKGTKPDRFDALARNFYWLNVTRFFGGCFSKGELPALVDRLAELSTTEGYKNTSHPRRLTAMLLSDWVFSQHQRSTQQAVGLLLSGLSLGRVIGRRPGHYYDNDESVLLPEGCGRKELFENSFKLLKRMPPLDYAMELCDLIGSNGLPEEIDGAWLRYIEPMRRERRERFFGYGRYLGSLSRCSEGSIHSLMASQPPTPRALLMLLEAGKTAVLYSSAEWCETVVGSLLDGERSHLSDRPNVLSRFGHSVLIHDYAEAFRSGSPESLVEVLRHRRYLRPETKDQHVEEVPDLEVLSRCRTIIELAESEVSRRAVEWTTDLGPWDRLVEGCRAFWGDRWQLRALANLAAGVRDADLKCADAVELFDQDRSLCRRARYARLKIGSSQVVGWWRDQEGKAKTPDDRMFLALVLWTWATFGAILKVRESAEALLEGLSEDQLRKVSAAVGFTASLPFRRESSVDVSSLPSALSPRFVALLGERVKRDNVYQLYQRYLKRYRGADAVVSEFLGECLTEMATREHRYWPQALAVVQRNYKREILWSLRVRGHGGRLEELMPIEIATEVVGKASKYPRDLAHLAAERCRIDVASRVAPLGDVAERERWFEAARSLPKPRQSG